MMSAEAVKKWAGAVHFVLMSTWLYFLAMGFTLMGDDRTWWTRWWCRMFIGLQISVLVFGCATLIEFQLRM